MKSRQDPKGQTTPIACIVSKLPRNKRAPITRQRIETLSDLVFGLALSIGALTLVGKTPTTPADIRAELFSFAFSFIILISVWTRYTRIMSVLRVETAATMLLNITLLFLVSVEPYLFSLVSSVRTLSALFDYATIVYSIDLAGLVGILALFTHLIIRENKSMPASLMAQHRRTRNAYVVSACLFVISTLPQFLSWSVAGTPLRVLFWYVPLVVSWSLRIPSIRKGKK